MNKKNILPKTCLLTIFLVFMVTATSNSLFGQTLKIKEDVAKQHETIEVSSSITEMNFCPNGDIKLQVLVTIKNLSDKPMVFCKACMTDMGIYISKDTDSIYQNKFVYDLFSMGYGRKLNLPNPLPFEKPFITIAQGDSFNFSVEPKLNSVNGKLILKNGKYVFVQFIDTWSDVTDLDIELKNRWAKDGLTFWTSGIITEPTFLEIRKTKTQNCK